MTDATASDRRRGEHRARNDERGAGLAEAAWSCSNVGALPRTTRSVARLASLLLARNVQHSLRLVTHSYAQSSALFVHVLPPLSKNAAEPVR